MSVVPKLNLNKHPKDCDNLSLVDARNIKISHDESCITNENSIITNALIQTAIHNIYRNNFLIRGIIPINTGIVLFVQDYNKVEANINKLDVFVYNEKTIDKDENIYLAYSGLSYHGGKFTGTFTYNVENDLIIAFSEYDCNNNELVPLRTINLGNPDKADAEDNGDIRQVESKLSIVPEVKLPAVSNIEYIKGNAYKGWYYLFIRYKINKNDYTQWYPIGYPIYVDTLNENQIVRYCFNRSLNIREAISQPDKPGINAKYYTNVTFPDEPWDGFGVGCSDYFSDSVDISNETFKISIKNLDNNYNIFQIGSICASKSYTKCYKTFDINIKGITNYYIFDIKNCEEYSTQELIATYYNYYNVKNIINYKNRLYIANYKENIKDVADYTKNIKIDLRKQYFILNDEVIDNGIYTDLNNRLQFYIQNFSEIQLSTFLNIDSNQDVVISFETVQLANIHYDNEGELIGDYNEIVDYIKDGELIKKDIKSRNTISITCKAGKCIICGVIDDWDTGGIKSNVTRSTNGYFTILIWDEPGESGISIYRYLIPSNLDTTFRGIYNIKIVDSDIEIKISRIESAILQGGEFINTQNSFNKRKLNSTLIPGEVYNFFIHFVDKYGNFTNGYKINNNNIIVAKNSLDDTSINLSDIIPVPVIYQDAQGDGQESKAFIAVTVNKSIKDTIIDINNNRFSQVYVTYNESKLTLYNPRPVKENTKVKLLNNYNSFENTNLKWFEVLDTNVNNFNIFINDKNDRLFKCPTSNLYDSNYVLYSAKLTNVIIPNGYVGYFISYEKPEYIRKVTGLLTRIDFRNIDAGNGYTNNNEHYTKIIKNSGNTSKSNNMLFFSSYFDIEDTLNLDYNILRIENDLFDYDDIKNDFVTNLIRQGKNPYDNIPNFYNFQQRNHVFNYMHDLNKVEILKEKSINTLYAMPNYKLSVGNSIQDNRVGVGTCLTIDDDYNLFNIYKADNSIYNKINLYKVSLLKSNTNIYTSNSKTLIKLTDIRYNFDDGYDYIDKGLDGHYTYRGTIIYNESGFNFNETDKIVKRIADNYPYYPFRDLDSKTKYNTYNLDIPFMCYLQHIEISNIFNESKSFKNAPAAQFFVMKQRSENANEDDSKYWPGCIVTPANSIDLFENRQGSADQFNPKTYSNYREDIKDIDIYNKTIRRSNVIQDESRENSWRKFSLEAYKNITENKGIITNLVGIGNLVLVHTEHSLFIFDLNNELKTIDQNIQLHQPDAFDVAYKEVFTSELGYGGLQDKRSAIVDQFGYIFYNNNDNNIYRFDNNQLAIISNDIVEWLVKAKPNNVRFANDIRNNRLLIKFDYDIFRKNEDSSTFTQKRNLVLSYNYKTQNFISTHSYYFRDAYNSKNRVYFINGFKSGNLVYDTIYNFTEAFNNYCTYDNVYGYANAVEGFNNSCKLSFIVNEGYDIVKFLEYITYKLYKVDESVRGDVPSPVKKLDTPYAGQWLRVYNDNVNTNDINITVDDESINSNEHKNIFGNYKKPYWDLGNWNFSYLRDMIGNEGDQSATVMSRLYGNYFIIEFEFLMQDRRIDFESLSYKISKL